VPLTVPAVPCHKLSIHELVITLCLVPTNAQAGVRQCAGPAKRIAADRFDVGIIADTPSTVKWRPGSFSILGCLGFVFAHRSCPAFPANLESGFKSLSLSGFSWAGATTRALGFVCRLLGSFVDSLGSFVGFLGFGGFVRGFVRRQKAEKCRFMRHKQR
jgi:hypothetical protein